VRQRGSDARCWWPVPSSLSTTEDIIVSHVLTLRNNRPIPARTTASSTRSSAVLQRTVPHPVPVAALEPLSFACRRFWLAWHSARHAASVVIERGSLGPEKRSSAVRGGSAVRCAFSFVMAVRRLLPLPLGTAATAGSACFHLCLCGAGQVLVFCGLRRRRACPGLYCA
jgi:hypothetical protein